MPTYDSFVEYKNDKNKFLSECEENIKPFIILKYGFVNSKEDELENFKKDNKIYYIGDKNNIQNISGILDNCENVSEYIKKLFPYSFIIWSKFKLIQPYFSKDDDDFYIISNPVLKEKAFKVPMVRGSGWKGTLSNAFKDLINEDIDICDKEKNRTLIERIESYIRIFGTGSEYIKDLEYYYKKRLKKEAYDINDLKDSLFKLLLFEFGIKLTKETIENIRKAKNNEEIFSVLNNNEYFVKIESITTHKGRAIFYPTYFDRLSLEVFNPHDRRKRAGTQPIYYEVVPESTEGILQIIYIPFDGMLNENNVLKSEAENDLNNILSAIEKISQTGVGAKTKLGWGTFEFSEKYYYVNEDLEIKEKLKEKGWLKCQN
jgi:CRISPR-associated protein Cmr2